MWIQMVLGSVKNSPREPFSAKTTSGWLCPNVATSAYSILQFGGRLGDECMMDIVGGAAQCEEPCIIGAPRKQNKLSWAVQRHGSRRSVFLCSKVLGNEVLEALSSRSLPSNALWVGRYSVRLNCAGRLRMQIGLSETERSP